MKKPWLSAVLNFFFMGLGYLYNGQKIILGSLLTLTAIGLTYLEQIHTFADGQVLQVHDPMAFKILFACVFIANSALALDAFQETKQMNTNT